MKIPKFIYPLVCLVLAGASAFAETAPAAPGAVAGTSASASPMSAAPGSEVPSQERITLRDVKGEVRVKGPAGDYRPARAGETLKARDTLITAHGSCRIVYENKTELFVAPDTTLVITEASVDRVKKTEINTLELQAGSMRVALKKLLNKSSRFEVGTPTAVATVRGTTFYLTAGSNQGQGFTDLYVDETKGGVLFKNKITGNEVNVPAFSLSKSFADGGIAEPKALDEDAQQKYLNDWAKQAGVTGAVLQQFGLEEIPLPGAQAASQNLADLTGAKDLTNDADQDRTSEQNIPGANGFPPVIPPPPTFPGFAGDGSGDNSGGDTGGNTGGDTGGGTGGDTGGNSGGDSNDAISLQEKQMIREEIGRIRGDLDFDHADANLAQISDNQTGKVFTDVHGNRVRTDQYIFQPIPEEVEFLSLTARTGSYQTGVSVAGFLIIFNRGITSEDGPLRNLPWNDYLNVVKHNQLTGQNVPSNIDEFIVHEHASHEPDLYPNLLEAVFQNPAGDQVAFDEIYDAPFLLNADQGDFWVQDKLATIQGIIQHNGNTVIGIDESIEGTHTYRINDGPFIQRPNDGTSDGSQTNGFAGNSHIADLDTEAGVNYYRNLPQNNGADFANHLHPAFFEDRFDADHILIGVFLPVNDAGQVIDAPGFRLRGVRDLFSPNPLVNGGNYNLETIFLFGHERDSNLVEDFRIDTIITPEIFVPYGTNGPNPAFPKALYPDDDHNSGGGN